MMDKLNDLPYGTRDDQILDVYFPETDMQGVFLYFHGGGLTGGDKEDAACFAPYLCRNGIAVVSANYRMYPEAKFPDFIDDAAQAVSWTHRHVNEHFGCDRLYVGGSSAGGYLTMMLCFNTDYLKRKGMIPEDVSGYFHDAGQPTAHFAVLQERKLDPRRLIVDETAPLYFVGTEPSHPPMRFVVSDHDIEGRYEQTQLMLATLSHFGYSGFDLVVKNGLHCAYCSQMDRQGESVFGQMILDFIRDCEARRQNHNQ